MDPIWLIVQGQVESVHQEPKLLQLCIARQHESEIQEKCRLDGYTLLEILESEEQAYAFRRKWQQESLRDYTRIVNRLPDLQPVQDRCFLAYLDEKVTWLPRLYQVNKVDYRRLQQTFPSVRLATDQELESDDIFTSCCLAREGWPELDTLRALNRPDDLPVDRYQDFCHRFDETQALLDELKYYCASQARDRAVELARQLFKEQVEETVDRIIEFFQVMKEGRLPELFELPPIYY